ncbi:MAG: multicopper oxidase domain-containing protein, partial [Gemmatimonadaceae bacterium]|nr:multicopper oxidase domain-containing protein [Gemmatimonadaceae bacterium]
ITVVNRLAESTALHWHGIELESSSDGVPGWTGGPGGGGAGGRRSPAVAPNDSFAAVMTPPRAGTFIYHSHALTTSQVGDGLYGPLIVLDSGEVYDPAREVTWIVGGRERGDGDRAFLLLNGERAPAPLSLVVGRRYLVRLINITESNTADVTLLEGEGADASPVVWRPLAKDAIPLSGARASVRPARLRTSVGETYDFEMVPPRPGVWRLEVRNGGDLMVRQQVLVR